MPLAPPVTMAVLSENFMTCPPDFVHMPPYGVAQKRRHRNTSYMTFILFGAIVNF